MRTLLGQWGACLGVWPYTDTVTDTSLYPGAGPVCKQIDPALIVWVMVSGAGAGGRKFKYVASQFPTKKRKLNHYNYRLYTAQGLNIKTAGKTVVCYLRF